MAKYPYLKDCAQCTQKFTIHRSSQKNQKFCSNLCATSAMQMHQKEIACLQCAGSLNRGQFKFCSQSCAATYNNTKRGKHSLERKIKIREGVYRSNNKTSTGSYNPEMPRCLQCNKICKRWNSKYCSKQCSSQSRILPVDRFGEKINTKIKIPKPFNCSCAHCGLKFTNKTQKKYCTAHAELYSHNGRARYWFSINVYKHPDLFDLESLTRVGFRSRINPNGYTRDHKVSVNEAIKNNYDPYYIKHVMNCELMLWEENNKKNTRSSITYQELVKLVDEYDSQHRPLTPAAEPAA